MYAMFFPVARKALTAPHTSTINRADKMHHWINDCIANFGPARRDFSAWDMHRYLRISVPSWLRRYPYDDLMAIFRHLPKVIADGVVVWGHVIQANRLLYQMGNDDCPGEVVYSLEDQSATPDDLRIIAQRLFKLKGTAPQESHAARIAAYLTSETERVFGLSVPPTISPRIKCQISTTYFARKHLPHRRLCSSLLPLIVFPWSPFIALPLPERFWAEGLRDYWKTCEAILSGSPRGARQYPLTK